MLGMTLENGFDLSDPAKRDVFIYYSPRNPTGRRPATRSSSATTRSAASRSTRTAPRSCPDSERVILRVPEGEDLRQAVRFPGGPTDNGPGHVGGAGLDFDSEGNLYLGVGDDVSPNAPGHDRYPPMDYRAAGALGRAQDLGELGRPARQGPAHHADGRHRRPAPSRASSATYTIPAGNMFAARHGEDPAGDLRDGLPPAVHGAGGPGQPGHRRRRRVLPRQQREQADRAPAGVCEWNLVDEPGFNGWPFCMGDNSPEQHARSSGTTRTTRRPGQQYDCSLAALPSDIRWAPGGRRRRSSRRSTASTRCPVRPRRRRSGRRTPARPAAIRWPTSATSRAGGMSPVTGPVYRYDAETAGPGAFPPYYDGSWFITNRGDQQRVLEGGPAPRGRQQDAARQRLGAAGSFGDAEQRVRDPEPLRPRRRALHGAAGTRAAAATRSARTRRTSSSRSSSRSRTSASRTRRRRPPATASPAASTRTSRAPTSRRRTPRSTAGDAGCAGIRSIEYRMNDAERVGDVHRAAVARVRATYTIEYRATDRFDNVSEVREVTLTVEDLNDDAAPAVTAEVAGHAERGRLLPVARHGDVRGDRRPDADQLDRVPRQPGRRVDEDGVRRRGAHAGAQRRVRRARLPLGRVAGDRRRRQRVRADRRRPSRSSAPCTYERSDEFDGATLDERWLRHTRNGGTPSDGAAGADAWPTALLTLPTNDFELDAANATTSVGPVNFLGQDAAGAGRRLDVETQLTVDYTGGWQHAGLIVRKRTTGTSSARRSPTASVRGDLRRAVEGQPGRHQQRGLARSRPAAT